MLVCDFCRDDYAEKEGECVTVKIRHSLEGKTICAPCLDEHLPVTGCSFHGGSHGGYERDFLGTDEPPEGWAYPAPYWREVLAALAGAVPRDPEAQRPSKEIGRLDVAGELHRKLDEI